MSRRIRRWPPGAWGYSSGAGADASGAGARRMSPLVSRARVEYERGMMETIGHQQKLGARLRRIGGQGDAPGSDARTCPG